MLNFSNRRIFLAIQPVDMRKSFDTLSFVVKHQLALEPLSGDAFLFVGKRKNRLKILVWEESGYWLFSKRLEVGTFSLPKATSDSKQFLTSSQFQLLLEGVIVLESRQLKRYHRP